MVRLFFYLLIIGCIFYLWHWFKGQKSFPQQVGESKSKYRFRPRKDPRETWVQIYETDSLEEAKMIQARLEEEELECILYEQGKKDIHGNLLKGIGIAVPKTGALRGQNIVARLPT